MWVIIVITICQVAVTNTFLWVRGYTTEAPITTFGAASGERAAVRKGYLSLHCGHLQMVWGVEVVLAYSAVMVVMVVMVATHADTAAED